MCQKYGYENVYFTVRMFLIFIRGIQKYYVLDPDNNLN